MTWHCGLWTVDAPGTKEIPERACGLAFNLSYLACSLKDRLPPSSTLTHITSFDPIKRPLKASSSQIALRLSLRVEKRDNITTLQKKKKNMWQSHDKTETAFINVRTWKKISLYLSGWSHWDMSLKMCPQHCFPVVWWSWRSSLVLLITFLLFQTCIKGIMSYILVEGTRVPLLFALIPFDYQRWGTCPLQYFALSPAPQVHHAIFYFFAGFFVAAKLVEMSLGMLATFSKVLKFPESKAQSILVSLNGFWTTHQCQKSFSVLLKNQCMML